MLSLTRCLMKSLGMSSTILEIYLLTAAKSFSVDQRCTDSYLFCRLEQIMTQCPLISLIFISEDRKLQGYNINISDGSDQYLLEWWLETPVPLWTGERSVPLGKDNLPSALIPEDMTYNRIKIVTYSAGVFLKCLLWWAHKRNTASHFKLMLSLQMSPHIAGSRKHHHQHFLKIHISQYIQCYHYCPLSCSMFVYINSGWKDDA